MNDVSAVESTTPSQVLTFNRWISKADMAAHIADLPHAANSGDVYCVLQP